MNKIYNFKLLFLLLFVLTILISNGFINKFEGKEYKAYENTHTYSSLIHEDTVHYFRSAQKISEDLNDGKSFFSSGESYNFTFLYPRIIFIFNKLINSDSLIIDDLNLEISFKNYKIFVFLQIIVYFLSILFLRSNLSKLFNKNLANIVSIILLINPILMQWHLSILTESIFLSFLIIIISFLIISKKNFQFFIIGLFIGILYAQRTIAFLYPLVFILFIFLLKENYLQRFLKFLSLTSGFLIILILIGLHNLNRADIFYFTPIQSKTDLQTYLEPHILSKSQNLTMKEVDKFLKERSQDILDKNNLNLEIERDKIIFLNQIRNKSLENILKNKILTIKIISKNYFHSVLLNPVQVYYASKYQRWIDYKNSLDHSFWLKLRVIITLIFFSISTIGFYFSFRVLDLKLNMFLIFSCLYFFGVSCWLGNTRYFTPSVLFMSVYFSIFLDQFFFKFHRKIN